MFNFASLTSIALVASVAGAAVIERSVMTKTPVYTAPSTGWEPANDTFGLVGIAYRGNLSLSGMFPAAVHSGAGQNWLEATYIGGAGGLSFNTTNGDIYYIANAGTEYAYPYSITFEGSGPTYGIIPWSWPSQYNFMGFNNGWANAGFSFDNVTNEVTHKSYEGRVLAICPSYGVSEDGGVEEVYGFMWREGSTTRNGTCADIKLKALITSV